MGKLAERLHGACVDVFVNVARAAATLAGVVVTWNPDATRRTRFKLHGMEAVRGAGGIPLALAPASRGRSALATSRVGLTWVRARLNHQWR